MEYRIITLCVGELGTNCYLLVKGNRAALIDPAADSGTILHTLQENGLTLDAILLTHGHFDHIGAVEELRTATGAPLYLHRADAELLSSPDKNYSTVFLDHAILCRDADVLLRDGDTIPFAGDDITVMHTPGHTMGSVIYRYADTLFCGDTIFKAGIGRTDLYGGDKRQLGASLVKLFRFYDENGKDYRLLPGHGEETRLSEERRSYRI